MVYVAVTFRSLLGTWDLFWSSHGITREISIHLLPVPSHDPPESILLYRLGSYKVLFISLPVSRGVSIPPSTVSGTLGRRNYSSANPILYNFDFASGHPYPRSRPRLSWETMCWLPTA